MVKTARQLTSSARGWRSTRAAVSGDTADGGDAEDHEEYLDGDPGPSCVQERGDVGVGGGVADHPGEDHEQDRGNPGDPDDPGQGQPGGRLLAGGIGHDEDGERQDDDGEDGEAAERPPPAERDTEPGTQRGAEGDADRRPGGDEGQGPAGQRGRGDSDRVAGQHPPQHPGQAAGDEAGGEGEGDVRGDRGGGVRQQEAAIPTRNRGLRRNRRVSTIAGMVTRTVPRA